MTTLDYVSRNMPRAVPWWRLFSRRRRSKIKKQLMEIFFCRQCVLTLGSIYELPCGVHQNEFERDIAVNWLALDRRIP